MARKSALHAGIRGNGPYSFSAILVPQERQKFAVGETKALQRGQFTASEVAVLFLCSDLSRFAALVVMRTVRIFRVVRVVQIGLASQRLLIWRGARRGLPTPAPVFWSCNNVAMIGRRY